MALSLPKTSQQILVVNGTHCSREPALARTEVGITKDGPGRQLARMGLPIHLMSLVATLPVLPAASLGWRPLARPASRLGWLHRACLGACGAVSMAVIVRGSILRVRKVGQGQREG